ncbi:MAG: hypothetical protein AAF995_02795 [Planctomycetota bacterium]
MQQPPAKANAPRSADRPWIGVHFTCAGRYLRISRAADGTRYIARCPACGQSLRFLVQPGGSSQRFYKVNCTAD